MAMTSIGSSSIGQQTTQFAPRPSLRQALDTSDSTGGKCVSAVGLRRRLLAGLAEVPKCLDLSYETEADPQAVLAELKALTKNGVWDATEVVKFDSSCSTQLNDDILQEVTSLCTSLSHVELLGARGFTSEGLVAFFGKTAKLQIAHLQECDGVNDAVLATLATSCPELERLCVSQCTEITERGLIALGTRGGKKLQWLEAAETSAVSDSSLSALCSCAPNLSGLDLSQCPLLTDAGVQSTAVCANLESLDLSGNSQLHDAAIRFLLPTTASSNPSSSAPREQTAVQSKKVPLRSLEELRLVGCSGITAKLIAKLRSERPPPFEIVDVDDDEDQAKSLSDSD
jgi:hypothetical protein